jgi:hypothetical protein
MLELVVAGKKRVFDFSPSELFHLGGFRLLSILRTLAIFTDANINIVAYRKSKAAIRDGSAERALTSNLEKPIAKPWHH